MGLLLCGE